MIESVPVLPSGTAASPPRSGALKWGLVGCGALSAVLIVGLVVFAMRARDITGALLQKTETMVLDECTPEVTAAQKEAFRGRFDAFIASATAGKVPVERISDLRTRLMAAIGDGKVTPQELSDLSVFLGEKTPPR